MNPYTFVPLPKSGAKCSDLSVSGDEPVFSGRIDCTLTTITQLAIPDVLKNPGSENAPKEYDFFNIDGVPAIPGSGLRGVVRSVFEVMTDSCMRLNDTDDDYFHTRVNKTSPGIIERSENGYILYKAERLRDKEDRGYNEKYDGKYKTGTVINIKNEPLEKGFKKDYVDRLKKNVEMYEGIYKAEYEAAIKNMEQNGGSLPVWYWQDPKTECYYLAPSQYSRAVFVNKPRDIVKEAGMQRCTSTKAVCEACSLFGFIKDGKDGDCRASRVRFTDAVCTEPENCFDGSFILPVLSTPRLSSFEFYLDHGGSENYKKFGFGPDSDGVTLAGRKFYWHNLNNPITHDDEFAKARPKMASKMQLMKKNRHFTFSVFFDNITDEQLKKLVFALNFGKNNGTSHGHKIGHGKPLGLGSVNIKVDRIVRRVYDGEVYSVDDVTGDILAGATTSLFEFTAEKQAFIQRVLYLNSTKNNVVDYPRVSGNGDIFEWFAKNRKWSSQGYIKMTQFLPKITDITQTLDRNAPSNNGTRGNGYGGRPAKKGGFNAYK